MINRILVIVFIGFFASSCIASDEVVNLQAGADQALGDGDIETALANYIAIVEM